MSNSDSIDHSADTTEIKSGSQYEDEPVFGWNPYSELVNGRVAMLAMLGLVLLEWFTKEDLFTWLGLR